MHSSISTSDELQLSKSLLIDLRISVEDETIVGEIFCILEAVILMPSPNPVSTNLDSNGERYVI